MICMYVVVVQWKAQEERVVAAGGQLEYVRLPALEAGGECGIKRPRY